MNLPGPKGSHAESDKRCADAWKMRITGRAWRDIAAETGWSNTQNTQNAVKSWLRRNPPDGIEIARRANGDGIRMIRAMLIGSLIKAQQAGDFAATASLARVVLDGYEREARLFGLHMVVPTEVNVRVSSASAILDRAEMELLALAEGDGPLDVEIVDDGEGVPG